MVRPLFARLPPPPDYAPMFPDWVLLDTVVRGANYDWKKMSMAQCSASLATTARTFVDVKSEAESQEEVVVEVEVSFLFVSPPDISGFIVHVGDYGLSNGACVVSTDGDAVLLAITMAAFKRRRYFVYTAGLGKPSLEVLPYPPNEFPQTQSVGILNHSQGYVVAALTPEYSANTSKAFTYKLFHYCSRTRTWSNKVVKLRSGFRSADRTHIIDHKTTKVIKVGENSLGWVDLWHGIISCNLLQEDPGMQFFNFPGPMDINSRYYGIIPARSFRDVIWTGNTLRIVEVEYNQDAKAGGDYSWKAIMKIRNKGTRWGTQNDVDSGNIILGEESWNLLWQSHTLPDHVPRSYHLSKLECFAPTLGIDDNVIYMMSRSFLSEEKPFGLFAAVDMNNNDARLVSFSTERLTYVDPNYCPCTVSRYFQNAGLNTIGGNLRWIGLIKLAVLHDILAAIETLKSLDAILMKAERPDETQLDQTHLRNCCVSVEMLGQCSWPLRLFFTPMRYPQPAFDAMSSHLKGSFLFWMIRLWPLWTRTSMPELSIACTSKYARS
ncbi:uncharacterized protein [Triticum aestivum]|uniref:uncharacterized protein isoform X2 n=1 Tax=Triticum aestivum TaxID=4565 RepID=UPI001D027F4A|nr:uncharacterized protein LOC123136911 isoform X2 [Triticum aestivum]